jgi:hypothetical protein
LRKGARLLVQDPHTREEVALFHPRLDSWLAHFRWDGVRVVGVTPTGRAAVDGQFFQRASGHASSMVAK